MGIRSRASSAEIRFTSRPIPFARETPRWSSANCSRLEASRMLPTASNAPSSLYRSIEYRRNRIIVGEGLNIVTSPTAWLVDPLVSSPFSSTRTSVRPAFTRCRATLQPVIPPPMTTTLARSTVPPTRVVGREPTPPHRPSTRPLLGWDLRERVLHLDTLRGLHLLHDEVHDQPEHRRPDHDHVRERAGCVGKAEALHEQERPDHERPEQEPERPEDRDHRRLAEPVLGTRRGLVQPLGPVRQQGRRERGERHHRPVRERDPQRPLRGPVH